MEISPLDNGNESVLKLKNERQNMVLNISVVYPVTVVIEVPDNFAALPPEEQEKIKKKILDEADDVPNCDLNPKIYEICDTEGNPVEGFEALLD